MMDILMLKLVWKIPIDMEERRYKDYNIYQDTDILEDLYNRRNYLYMINRICLPDDSFSFSYILSIDVCRNHYHFRCNLFFLKERGSKNLFAVGWKLEEVDEQWDIAHEEVELRELW